MPKYNFINMILLILAAIGIIFYLTTITEIEKIYANQKTNLNFTGFDVTVTSDDNIPDWLLEDIKNNIMKTFMTREEGKPFSTTNNISQIQINITTDEGTNKDESSKANIILTSHKYVEDDGSKYDDIIGTVKNIGDVIADWVEVGFTFYDNNNNIVSTDYTFADPSKLNANQKAPFSIMIDKGETGLAAKYELSLKWVNPDGSEEYIEDVDVTKDPQEKIPIIENTQQEREIEKIPFFTTNAKDINKFENKAEDD